MADVLDTLDAGRRGVQLRQFVDRIRHLLSFIPGLYVLGSIVLSQLLLLFDRSLSGESVPDYVTTTVGSARSVFATLAGGLITAITLLLSMTLITVQLASSQFSPRTLRDWIGDRVLQHTVGLALGSTVFALLALRSTRSFGEGGREIVPHGTVLVAVLLGVASLFMLVRSVDHMANRTRIGAVADRIARDTIDTIETDEKLRAGQHPTGVPAARTVRDGGRRDGADDGSDGVPHGVPDDSAVVEAVGAGWVQQIDAATLIAAVPEGSTVWVAVPIGAYVSEHTPLAWISPDPGDDGECEAAVASAFALGDTRTMQQDVAYGLMQLTDIALRALSPGINDPSTANDVVVHIGRLLLRLWEVPAASSEVNDDDRTVILRQVEHADHLRRSCEPIRRYGADNPDVLATLLRMLDELRSETIRRELPGPIEPIAEMVRAIDATAQRDLWSDQERDAFRQLVDRWSVAAAR